MCHVAVIPSVNEASTDDLMGKVAIVIDVLRATSTIITALHHGCAGVMPVETVYQAREIRSGENVLLGGERNGKKIPGFDYGNSPFEYLSSELQGKLLVMTTTNGTRAIQKSAKASHVIAAAMLNARAAAKQALTWNKDIAIVCAGTKDAFSLEDGLCAGLVIREMTDISDTKPRLNDTALAMLLAYEQVRDRLAETILMCRNGQRLARAGLAEEVHYCTQTNVLDTVPVLADGILTSGF